MFGLGGQEILIISVIVFLLFGAKKIPEFFHALGSVPGSFKRGVKEAEKISKELETVGEEAKNC